MLCEKKEIKPFFRSRKMWFPHLIFYIYVDVPGRACLWSIRFVRVGQLFPHSPSWPIFLFLVEGTADKDINSYSESVAKIQTSCFMGNVDSMFEIFRRKSIFIRQLANAWHIHVVRCVSCTFCFSYKCLIRRHFRSMRFRNQIISSSLEVIV